jgi:ATP-binding cassette subfamily D (ALD) protein 3
LLVKDVSFDLKPGENLFVTGANGAGKTSLFRVLAGLWEPASGVVTRPDVQRSDDDDDDDDDDSRDASEEEEEGGTETTSSAASRPFQVFYVPQKPYLVSGSLRDQVMYPRAGSSDFDDEIIEALSRVNLLKLVNAHGLDRVPHDWADVLSGGEKQRVGLARLYFHKPSYAVLDEATSAINPDEEGSFYDHLGTLGITAFSIAHRMELKKFHHSHLHFHADGTGGWTLKRIKK